MDGKELLQRIAQQAKENELLQPPAGGSSLIEGALEDGAETGLPMAQVIGEEEVRKANDILHKYKAGKAQLDKRIVDNELWFRMGHWKNYENKGTPSANIANACLTDVSCSVSSRIFSIALHIAVTPFVSSLK